MPDESITESNSPQPKPERKPSSRFFTILKYLDNAVNWLTGLSKLSAQEREDAGIYLRDQRYK